MNVWKNTVIAFILGVVAGIAGAGLIAYTANIGELESARSLAEQYRIAEQSARERITKVESDNRRLQKHFDDAGRITERLYESARSNVGDSRSAIGLVKEIIDQIQSLDRILNRGDTPGGGSGDSGGSVD